MKFVVSGLSFRYASRIALDDVSFHVGESELVGILGPNGAGKSTLLRCMHAALTPTRGAVTVGDVDLSTLPRREVAKLVGVVPQSCSPGFRVDVAAFVGMGRFAHESFLGAASAEDRAAVRDALGAVDMLGFADRSVLELSGGEFRRVLIAQAIAQHAPVLLLDEPVQQLDLRHQIEVMELIRSVAKRRGCTGVAVLHDLSLAARYCDSLILLAHGRVVAVGPPESVITPAHLRDVYGVEATVDRCLVTGSLRATAIRALAPPDSTNAGVGSTDRDFAELRGVVEP
jgi:iron complex transport system ATP-binding protein